MIFGPDISFEIPVRVCLLNGFAPGGRQTRFFEEHVRADEIHGAKGFAIVEKYCNTSELQAFALNRSSPGVLANRLTGSKR